MNKLPRIPSPPSHYWREFRHSVMPVLVFGGVLAMTVLLWNKALVPSSMIGEVEMVRANVNSIVPGTVIEMQVDLLQRVEKDQVIATIITMEPEVLSANLAAVAAELETTRARMLTDQARLVMDQARSVDDLEQLRLNWLNAKVSLATERVNLQYAINEFQRVSKLFQDKAVTEMEYDLTRSRRDALQSKVDEMGKLVAEMERSIERLRPTSGVTNILSNEAVAAAINARQELIKQQTRPIILRAPMAGVVSAVLHRAGEKVTAGEPILTISALHSDRIVGYIRQPLPKKPTPGAPVEVWSRGGKRAVGMGKVLRVGTQMEPINPTLLPQGQGQGRTPEFGLPILVSLPPNLPLLPGEMVDLQWAK